MFVAPPPTHPPTPDTHTHWGDPFFYHLHPLMFFLRCPSPIETDQERSSKTLTDKLAGRLLFLLKGRRVVPGLTVSQRGGAVGCRYRDFGHNSFKVACLSDSHQSSGRGSCPLVGMCFFRVSVSGLTGRVNALGASEGLSGSHTREPSSHCRFVCRKA